MATKQQTTDLTYADLERMFPGVDNVRRELEKLGMHRTGQAGHLVLWELRRASGREKKPACRPNC